ncbi:hypothetical protein [Nocardia brevicatena]|uniref:hypothetical protein n=1 Tax=Nocardia brevicatena TaxID=37327 RepID=UPI000592AD8C|nr:hypothetical protein [Nocardia brevicatena]
MTGHAPTIAAPRRAIVLCRQDCDTHTLKRIVQRHGLTVVHTVFAEIKLELAAAVAVQHMLEHDAEVVVVPHLSKHAVQQPRPWRAVAAVVDLVTATGVLECRLNPPTR